MKSFSERTLPDLIGSTGLFTDGDWIESKDQDPNGDVRLIQLADIGDGEFLDKSARFLTSDKATELKCTFLEPGDILLARMPDPLGRACIFPGNPRPCVVAVDICIIRLARGNIDKNWLVRQINSPEFRFKISRFATGTTRKRISRSNLAKIRFSVPPLEEQRRIAAILDTADTLRTKRRQAIAKLDTLLQSTFLTMFGDPVTNPMGWETLTLGEVIVNGPQNGLYKPASDYGSGTPIIRIDSFYSGNVTDPDELRRVRIDSRIKEKYAVRVNDILVNRVNSRSHLGKSALVPTLKETTVFESNMMRFAIDSSLLDPKYLITLLQHDYIKNQILTKARDAVNQSSINQGDVCSLEVRVPHLQMQRKFVEFQQAVSVQKERLVQSAKAENNLYNSLQQRAFRGDL